MYSISTEDAEEVQLHKYSDVVYIYKFSHYKGDRLNPQTDSVGHGGSVRLKANVQCLFRKTPSCDCHSFARQQTVSTHC